MPDDTSEFGFEMEEVDRSAVLQEAAQKIDILVKGHVGKGAPPGPSAEGDLVRNLVEDQASLSIYPDVYRLTDKDFLDRPRPVPVRFKELTDRFNFYWIRFPVGLMPQNGWAFNRLRVRVEFNEGAAPHTRPRAYQILPDRKFQALVKINLSLEVQLDENFEFSAQAAGPVPLPGGVGEAAAGVDVKTAANLGMVVGPFQYRIVKTQINHNSTGLEWVTWDLEGAQFVHENPPDLVVIAQVPRETRKLTVQAKMQAHRYFPMLANSVQKLVQQLPEALKAFFFGGLPTTPDLKTYDLTKHL